MLPAYLGQVQGYNAEQIGNVLAWTGLPQLLLIPLVPKLMQRFDARYHRASPACCCSPTARFMNTTMSLDYSGDQFWIPNIVRAIGQALMLTPLTSSRLGSIAPQDAAAASGICNMLRNLGGAIGTAVLATIVTKREQFHSNIIGQSVDARPRGGAQPDRADDQTTSWPTAWPIRPPRISRPSLRSARPSSARRW